MEVIIINLILIFPLEILIKNEDIIGMDGKYSNK